MAYRDRVADLSNRLAPQDSAGGPWAGARGAPGLVVVGWVGNRCNRSEQTMGFTGGARREI